MSRPPMGLQCNACVLSHRIGPKTYVIRHYEISIAVFLRWDTEGSVRSIDPEFIKKCTSANCVGPRVLGIQYIIHHEVRIVQNSTRLTRWSTSVPRLSLEL